MDRNEAIKLIDDRMCFGRGKWSKHHVPEIDDYWKAGQMAIKALKGKDIDVPANSALDHIHNVVAEREYQRGYEQGKNDAKAEAIPVSWIESVIKKLRSMDFDLARMTAGQIEAMLRKWREEQEGELHEID